MKMESEQKREGCRCCLCQRAAGVGSSAVSWAPGSPQSVACPPGYRQCQPGRKGGAFVLCVHKISLRSSTVASASLLSLHPLVWRWLFWLQVVFHTELRHSVPAHLLPQALCCHLFVYLNTCLLPSIKFQCCFLGLSAQVWLMGRVWCAPAVGTAVTVISS